MHFLHETASSIVTLHHGMSLYVPDGHFHAFLVFFLKVNSVLSIMVKTIFKSKN